jgi:hypothetical protein
MRPHLRARRDRRGSAAQQAGSPRSPDHIRRRDGGGLRAGVDHRHAFRNFLRPDARLGTYSLTRQSHLSNPACEVVGPRPPAVRAGAGGQGDGDDAQGGARRNVARRRAGPAPPAQPPAPGVSGKRILQIDSRTGWSAGFSGKRILDKDSSELLDSVKRILRLLNSRIRLPTRSLRILRTWRHACRRRR